jgi:hypothetical protein
LCRCGRGRVFDNLNTGSSVYIRSRFRCMCKHNLANNTGSLGWGVVVVKSTMDIRNFSFRSCQVRTRGGWFGPVLNARKHLFFTYTPLFKFSPFQKSSLKNIHRRGDIFPPCHPNARLDRVCMSALSVVLSCVKTVTVRVHRQMFRGTTGPLVVSL